MTRLKVVLRLISNAVPHYRLPHSFKSHFLKWKTKDCKTCLGYILLPDATVPSQIMLDSTLAFLPPGRQGQTLVFRTVISPNTERISAKLFTAVSNGVQSLLDFFFLLLFPVPGTEWYKTNKKQDNKNKVYFFRRTCLTGKLALNPLSHWLFYAQYDTFGLACFKILM